MAAKATKKIVRRRRPSGATSVCAALCGLLCVGSPTMAQVSPGNGYDPVFPVLFPNPTGANGYEELTQAGDLAQGSKVWGLGEKSGATLAMERMILNDPDIRRALALMRAGLRKPMVSLRDPKTAGADTISSHFALFRELERLMKIEQHLALADGRVDDALSAMEDGLRLAQCLPADGIISALVRISMDAVAINLIARNKGQLAYRDCERVERICESFLAVPDTFAAALEGERDFAVKMYRNQRMTPAAVIEMAYPPSTDEEGKEEETPEERAFREYAQAHPDEIENKLNQAADGIAAYYNAWIGEAKKPVWERKPSPLPKGDNFVGPLMEAALPTLGLAQGKQDSDRTNLHLLGTFAALQRYHWKWNCYPATLQALRSPLLTQDPFTGDYLIYKREGEAYDLHSVGPFSEETKKRTSLYLPYRAK